MTTKYICAYCDKGVYIDTHPVKCPECGNRWFTNILPEEEDERCKQMYAPNHNDGVHP